MKKRIIVLAMTMVMAVSMAACGTKESDKEKDNGRIQNVGNNEINEPSKEAINNKQDGGSESPNQIANSADTTKYDSTDGYPPVEPGLKEFYKEAEKLYLDMVFFRVESDYQDGITIGEEGNAVVYSLVTDERFKTLSDLQDTLYKYFTKEFADGLIFDENDEYDRFMEKDGKLYVLAAGRGGNIQYAGHVFEQVEADENRINMPVKVYYAKYATPYETFYTTPEDLDAYEVKEMTQSMVKVNGEWRFDNFELFF